MSKRRELSNDGINWLVVEPGVAYDVSLYRHSREVEVEDEGGEGDVGTVVASVGAPEKNVLELFAERQLAIFEALRRLGFPSDDIYVAFYNGGELFTEVRQGKREFHITISQGQKVDSDAYHTVWMKMAEEWNKGTEEHRKKIYESNMPPGFAVSLIIALKNKGFTLPSTGLW